MKPSQRTTWIGCTIVAGLALACGSESGLDETALAEGDEVSSEPSDTEAMLDREALMGADVTSEEMVVLDEYVERAGLGEPTYAKGRLLGWEDAMMTVDDVLTRVTRMDEVTLIEKGYAGQNVANPGSGNNIEFWRPDIGLRIYVIVENNVDNAVFTAVGEVLSEWTGLAVDCLGTGIFQVIKRSDYTGLTQDKKDTAYEVEFQFVSKAAAGWPCGTGEIGCAFFPVDQQIKVNGSFVPRLAIGRRVTLDKDSHPVNNITNLKKTLRHEFGHTFGFQHQQLSDSVQIPGTQSCGQICSVGQLYPSVMRSAGQGGVFQSDDTKSLRTLYANETNRANDDCSYVDGFRLLAALP